MTLSRAPRFSTFGGSRADPASKDRPVLGVGSRVLVTCRSNGSSRVPLMDDNNTIALATIADGVEVEILAWRPRRGGDTRYRVVSTSGGVEGWLGATNLKARPLPVVPKVAAPMLSARLALPTRTASGQSQRRAPAAATATKAAVAGGSKTAVATASKTTVAVPTRPGGAATSRTAVAVPGKIAVATASKPAIAGGRKTAVATASKPVVAGGRKTAVATRSKTAVAVASKPAVARGGKTVAHASRNTRKGSR